MDTYDLMTHPPYLNSHNQNTPNTVYQRKKHKKRNFDNDNKKEGGFFSWIPIIGPAVDTIVNTVVDTTGLNYVVGAIKSLVNITVGPAFTAITDASGYLINQAETAYDATLGTVVPLDFLPGGRLYQDLAKLPALIPNILQMVGGIGELSKQFDQIITKSDPIASQLSGSTTGATGSVDMNHFGIYFSPDGCPQDIVYQSEKSRGFSKAIYGGPSQYPSRDLGWVLMIVRNEDIPILVQYGFQVVKAFNPWWGLFRARACLTYKIPGLYSFAKTGTVKVGFPVIRADLANTAQLIGSENIGAQLDDPNLTWIHPYLAPVSSSTIDFTSNLPTGTQTSSDKLGVTSYGTNYPVTPNLVIGGSGILVRQQPSDFSNEIAMKNTWDTAAYRYNTNYGVLSPSSATDLALGARSGYVMALAIDNIATRTVAETDPIEMSCPFGTHLEIQNTSYGVDTRVLTDPTPFQKYCSGKDDCTIPANQYNVIAGSDPAWGIVKNFTVTYRCNKP